MTDMEQKQQKGYDKTLIIVSLIFVAAFCIWFILDPEESLTILNDFANSFVFTFDWLFMGFAVVMLIISMWWAFSKRGNIVMGPPGTKPQYSLAAYIIMLFCAGMAAGSCIFSMIEWAYYYALPPFGLEPYSLEAMEMSLPYNYYHWGMGVAALNMLLAIPYCYSYYVRKNNTLRLGDITGLMMGGKKCTRAMVKLVNVIFIICVLGSLCCTLGLGIPNISQCIQSLTGIKNTMAINVGCILIISVIFSFSSYLGISKGLKKLSAINTIWCIAFLTIILVTGPTTFIIKNILHSLGILVAYFPRMALNLDPIFESGFAQNWTVFFYCYAWGFVAMTAVVTVKISRGRTFKEMILGNVVGVPAGLVVMMGINNSNSMKMQLDGTLDVAGIVMSEGNHAAIVEILGHTIMGPVIGVIAFAVMITLFIATTMDGASIALAETTVAVADGEEEAQPIMRLFWCIVLSAIPLVLTAIGAGLDSLQALVNVIGWPIMIVGIYVLYKTFQWAKEDGY